MHKKPRLIAAALFLGAGLSLHAQDLPLKKSEVKAVQKSKKYYQKDQYDKAISTLNKVLMKHDHDADLWTLMVAYELNRYSWQKQQEQSEMMAQLMKSLTSGKKNLTINVDGKSTLYYSDFISTCRMATLKSDGQQSASMYLRYQFVDEPVDTAVKKEAKDKFEDAEKAFQDKDFPQAIRLYNEALTLDTSYYQASLYIGDSYWNDNQPEKAMDYFHRAINRRPNRLEPRKYLVDALENLNRWDEAYKECVSAITVHPDVGMFDRLNRITTKQSKTFTRHWMPRDYYPNLAGKDQDAISNDPWKLYREAKEKISGYCDENGVITKTNSLTSQKYMEAYCWEYMLKNSTSKEGEFDFARKMMNAGYLDCYVFVSMYHISLNKQYEDFSKNNASRIKEYFDTYLVK